MKPINLVLDTDIGPDCDDAGALACAHALQTEGFCRLLAVTHCTSSPWGAGCIDAINRWYGRGDIPVGTLKTPGFLSLPEYTKYNRFIAQNYPNRYADGNGVPDAVSVLRRALASEDDGSVVLCAIGPLVNLADLLRSKPDDISGLDGRSLVALKASRLVVMGGGWKGPEWNFQMDPRSAAYVCDVWPGEVWFSTFDVGETIITGRGWNEPEGANPICDAYRLYCTDGRMSWDLTAVWAAVMGSKQFFPLSEPGRISVDEGGSSVWTSNATGRHWYLKKAMPDEEIASYLDHLIKASAYR